MGLSCYITCRNNLSIAQHLLNRNGWWKEEEQEALFLEAISACVTLMDTSRYCAPATTNTTLVHLSLRMDILPFTPLTATIWIFFANSFTASITLWMAAHWSNTQASATTSYDPSCIIFLECQTSVLCKLGRLFFSWGIPCEYVLGLMECGFFGICLFPPQSVDSLMICQLVSEKKMGRSSSSL